MKSLLLIACSRRKLRAKNLLPALQRYDGGSYRVIRKAQREGAIRPNLDIRIISAKFGLIDDARPIPYYQQRITKKRAAELQSEVCYALNQTLSQNDYEEIYVDVGIDYLLILRKMRFQNKIAPIIATGRIGERLARLKQWLTNS